MLLLVNCGCNLLPKEIKINVKEHNYGWYFIFIETDTTCSLNFIDEGINMCNSKSVCLKMNDFNKYYFSAYLCGKKEKISGKMKMATYRGNTNEKICFHFYYPDPNVYPDEVLDMPDYNEEKKYEKYRETSFLLDGVQNGIYDSLVKIDTLCVGSHSKPWAFPTKSELFNDSLCQNIPLDSCLKLITRPSP